MTTYTPAMDATPWYRHRWPWLLMLGPAIVVVAGIATLWLAVRSDDGLVADDYYKRGLAINQTIGRLERAAELGLAGTIDIAPEGTVRARLESATGPEPLPPAVRIVLAHPARAGEDVRATLVRAPDGSYLGRTAPLPRVRWQLIVETDEWRLPAVEIDGPATGIRVAAARGRGQ
ncbi:MAG TPA: FixH family protein [Casimicrobiaceae bacterium]|nr:FixH family protein [Casimicrobiaceae bacterium]